MASSVIEYVISSNVEYYPNYHDLYNMIDNPSFDPDVDLFSRRYVVDEGYDYSNMRFAMIYEGRDLILVGDIDEESEFHDLVGDLTIQLRGDDVLGFSIILDLIHQGTVPSSLTLWNTYISSLLLAEGSRFLQEAETGIPFFLSSSNNPDLLADPVRKLWVVDHESLEDKGILTVLQLMSAINEGIVAVDNPTTLSLNYFYKEDYIENIDVGNVISTLNESASENFILEYTSTLEEIVVRAEGEESIENMARNLLNDGLISEIVEFGTDEVKVYFNTEEDLYVRVVIQDIE